VAGRHDLRYQRILSYVLPFAVGVIKSTWVYLFELFKMMGQLCSSGAGNVESEVQLEGLICMYCLDLVVSSVFPNQFFR
jgi:hypothetical protein